MTFSEHKVRGTSPSDPQTRPQRLVRMKAVAMLLVLLAFFALFDDKREIILANRLFDAYQTLMPRQRASAPAIIVAIDEASLKAHGQWPWPRTVVAHLLDMINTAKPAAVGIDIIFAEADRFNPERLPEALPDLAPALREALKKLPSPDERLAAVLGKGPFVLGMAGLEEGNGQVPAGAAPPAGRGRRSGALPEKIPGTAPQYRCHQCRRPWQRSAERRYRGRHRPPVAPFG